MKARAATVSRLADAVRSDMISQMCDIAVRLDRKITWDPKTEEIVGDSEATQDDAPAHALALVDLTTCEPQGGHCATRFVNPDSKVGCPPYRIEYAGTHLRFLPWPASPSCRPRPRSQTDDASRLRVLLTYGGHDFQEKEFFAMWDAMPGVTYTKAPLPAVGRPAQAGSGEGVRRDRHATTWSRSSSPRSGRPSSPCWTGDRPGLPAPQFLRKPSSWPEFHKIIGGKYLALKQARRSTAGSTARRPTSMARTSRSQIADKDHPITQGLADFVIHDETYGSTYVDPRSTSC